MGLKEKYEDLLELGKRFEVTNGGVSEEAGKLKVWGTTRYQLESDLLWDKIKTYPNWQDEITADFKAERSDIHGIHVVQPGDTLSKIAKLHLDDPNRYTEIFNANRNILSDPDKIQVGQQLTIPKK